MTAHSGNPFLSLSLSSSPLQLIFTSNCMNIQFVFKRISFPFLPLRYFCCYCCLNDFSVFCSSSLFYLDFLLFFPFFSSFDDIWLTVWLQFLVWRSVALITGGIAMVAVDAVPPLGSQWTISSIGIRSDTFWHRSTFERTRLQSTFITGSGSLLTIFAYCWFCVDVAEVSR